MIEKRFISSEEGEIRAYSVDNERVIEGYAAKFNIESRLLAEGGRFFNEVILPGAFRESLNDDVYMTFNHSRDQVYARTTNGTLILTEDEKGLKFRAVLNDTTGANDLYKMIERGDVFENSFAFMIEKDGQTWKRTQDGKHVREISKISKLIDTSVVTHAAYPETEVVVVRGLEEYFEDEKPNIIDLFKEKNQLEWIKINKMK